MLAAVDFCSFEFFTCQIFTTDLRVPEAQIQVQVYQEERLGIEKVGMQLGAVSPGWQGQAKLGERQENARYSNRA
jgi:hypothetical protein